MDDFLWSLDSIEPFTVYVLLTMVLAVSMFIREIVGSGMMAVCSAPLLIFGGLLSHYLARAMMFTVSYDKDSNELIIVGMGVFTALVAMITAVYLTSVFRDWRARLAKPLPADAKRR